MVNKKEYDREYYLANRDKQLARSRAWHHAKKDGYWNGELDSNSNVGRGFISEIIVANVLGLGNNANCNCAAGFGFKYDLYDASEYQAVNVKSSKLRATGHWGFHLTNKHTPDTYIFIAYSENYKNIEHVWIIPAYTVIVSDKKVLTVRNSNKGLSRVQEFEVSNVMYNVYLHTMSIDRCSVLKSPDRMSDIVAGVLG